MINTMSNENRLNNDRQEHENNISSLLEQIVEQLVRIYTHIYIHCLFYYNNSNLRSKSSIVTES
mgnify:FL=1